jgi:hypothetical protein
MHVGAFCRCYNRPDMGDDFSDGVKRALASRVGNLCSNPDCRALTSGPQDDPAKAINIGVAAHITAASQGGPRYDSDLLPEERSGPSNGIWLCQNCAKLVDNDSVRFTVGLLGKWKDNAESHARDRIGKTIPAVGSYVPDLNIYDRVRIEPIVPRWCEQSIWILKSIDDGCFRFEKIGSFATIAIPNSFIEKAHRFTGDTSGLVLLAGRLQWISVGQHWKLFSEKPPVDSEDEHGFSRSVALEYPGMRGLVNGVAWARRDRLPQILGQGKYIFYDEDGKYLKVPGRDVDLVLISDQP